MRSDNLIKNLLKAAAIVEGAYFALTILACAACDLLLNGKLGRAFGGFYANDTRLGFPLPCAVQAVILTGAFFGVWCFLHNAVQPQKYSGTGGILLIVLYFFTAVCSTVVNIVSNRYYSMMYSAAYMSKYAIFSSNFFTPVKMLHSAAIILMFVAFGMEWYRASLIREQTQNAAAAVNRG